ncbi:MAG: hypothetical protein IJ088_07590 [Clostridia bacterium]|nr:hypothetical protein [Clostridia bacterium]
MDRISQILADPNRTWDVTDYSKASSWHQIPGIIKDVDTFFVYPTDYMALEEGAPDYAPLDNPEMVEGAKFDHKHLPAYTRQRLTCLCRFTVRPG